LRISLDDWALGAEGDGGPELGEESLIFGKVVGGLVAILRLEVELGGVAKLFLAMPRTAMF
jgi:hypothetical protein